MHDADLDLARRARAGSREARAALAQRLGVVPNVIAALNKRLGSPLGPEDVEDAAQDAVVAIWRQLPGYAGRSALESWAYGFCQNVLSDRLRARRRRPRHVEHRAEVEPRSTDGSAPAEEELDLVCAALDKMEQREEAEIVRLRHFEGLEFAKLGEVLAISPNTAKTRYYRGLRRLRAMLDPLRREGVL